jgi:hypothetical protein
MTGSDLKTGGAARAPFGLAILHEVTGIANALAHGNEAHAVAPGKSFCAEWN